MIPYTAAIHNSVYRILTSERMLQMVDIMAFNLHVPEIDRKHANKQKQLDCLSMISNDTVVRVQYCEYK